jgi:acetyl esterase/lipase
MSFTLDPEVARAMAPMGEAMAGTTPPAVGDVDARRALWEPILDAAGKATVPDPHVAPLAIWSYDDSRTAWPALLGEAAGGPGVPVTAAPARLEDATGLPPAYLEIGQIDAFRDETAAYAITLSRAGVPVEFHLHPGVPHEFDSIAFEADVARRAIADRIRVLKSI